MKIQRKWFLLFLLTIILFIPGCSASEPAADSINNVLAKDKTSQTTSEASASNTPINTNGPTTTNKNASLTYNDLSAEEKKIYNEIKNVLQKNGQYQIRFSNNSIQGSIKYDFNLDGKIEELKYYTQADEYYSSTKKVKIQINDAFVEDEFSSNYGGLSCLKIIDSDKSDKFIDITIVEGELSDRVNNVFYRYTGNKISQVGYLTGDILNYSGDGKIYFWGGSLYENKLKFDTNLVLVYYDIKQNKQFTSDQIVGKTITADRNIVLYKAKDGVVFDTPMTQEDILRSYKYKIIREIKEKEKFTVLSIDGLITKETYKGGREYYKNHDNGVKIKTLKGEIGWIGGFHIIFE